MLGACVADDESSPPPAAFEEQAVLEVDTVERGPDAEAAADICGLAAGLSRDNVCSLVCDPEGFQARLIDDGMSGGRCYQFRCDLGADTVISVGMCLP